MKLRNKKTGEIIDDGYVRETHDFQFDGQKHVLAVFKGNGHRPPERVSGAYKSLAELNEEWEDAPEEPKKYWYITGEGYICRDDIKYSEWIEERKQIGNYFETKEEAEKAVERLKALNKLCRKGFEFNGVEMFGSGLIRIEASIPINEKTTLQERSDITDSLYLLFGGEE